MAVMRGIEGGFAVARSARDGLLTLSDDRGRILAETSAVGRDDVVSLVAELPVRGGATPYRLWGDGFGAGCVALALALAALALGSTSKGRNADARLGPGVAGGRGAGTQ
jgi:apolipoprotein N-acyltransferase